MFGKLLAWFKSNLTIFLIIGCSLIGSFVLVCIGTIPTITGLVCFTEALKIWLAPKIYLIEYAAHLLKGN